MENKDKLKRVAHGFNIALKVVGIITLVGAIFSFILMIVSFAMGGTGALVKIYESNPEVLKDVVVDTRFEIQDYFKTRDLTLGELYELGELNQLMYMFGVLFLFSLIESIILIIVLIVFRKVFYRLQTTESPFTFDNSRDLRIAFILISILVSLNSLVIGLVVAGLLACMYVMFLYGCKLQENEDQTL